MENTVCIYALIDPRTDEIRYVGQTVNPVQRLDNHLLRGRGSKAKNRWLENLYKSHNIPKMLVLDWVSPSDADATESQWIKTLLSDGVTLTNSTFNPQGVRYNPHIGGRAPKQTERVFQYMDQIYATEQRIPAFSEVMDVLQIAKATASEARSRWLVERGIGENGHSQD